MAGSSLSIITPPLRQGRGSKCLSPLRRLSYMSLVHWCFSAIDVVAPVLVCADRKAVPVAARTERAVYGPDAIVVMGRLSNAIQCRYLVY